METGNWKLEFSVRFILGLDFAAGGKVFVSGSDAELTATFRRADQLREEWNSLSPLKRLEIE